jgi:hypothetical protein
MKKIFKFNLIALLMVILALPALAVDPVSAIKGSSGGQFVKVGAAGGQFLKIGVGARAAGMGGAYSSVADDLTALYWNPAGLADVKGVSGSFSYTSWFYGFSHMFAAATMPLGTNFQIAVQIISLTSQNIEVTTFDQPDGTGLFYKVQDLSGGLTLSGFLTNQFSFGVTAKYVSNGIANLSAGGIAFDIGTKYETGVQGIKIGFAIMNLGTEQQYSGSDLQSTMKLDPAFKQAPQDFAILAYPFQLPLTFRAGISSELIKSEEHALTAAFDFVTMSDISEQFIIGAEYTWNDLLSLRGGYVFGQSQFNICGGVGIKYIGGGLDGALDYSLTPTVNLGLVNRIGVSVKMK